jgi:heptosyltransferase-3
MRSLLLFHYWLLNQIIELVKGTIYPSKNLHNPSRILVVRKGNLGDIICSVEAFEAIKNNYPNASIDIITTTGKLSLLGVYNVLPDGYFNDLISYNDYNWFKLFKRIKSKSYDLVIELPPDVDTLFNQLRNMIFYRLSGINNGFGWGISRTNFLHKQQVRLLEFDNEQTRLKNILEKQEIEVSPEKVKALLFSDQDKKDAIVLMGKMPVKSNTVAICIGAKLDKKKWPIEYFEAVINDLQQEGMQIIAIGDKQDEQEISGLNNSNIINLCGKLTVRQSAAVLSLCSFTICNDSGPMHLSYSVGTPVIAVFSSRNYNGKWFPTNDGINRVFYNKTINCAGCMNNACASNECMKSVLPVDVITAMNAFLEQTPN